MPAPRRPSPSSPATDQHVTATSPPSAAVTSPRSPAGSSPFSVAANSRYLDHVAGEWIDGHDVLEMQYFVRPDRATEVFEEWLPRRWDWYVAYGADPARLRLREHAADELAHYAKKAVDIEYRFPFGWKELEGIHDRGDFDLGSHQQASGENLEYFDPVTNEHFVPHIVETAAGADRAPFTFLIDAYREEEVKGEKRVSLALHPQLAPYKVAVLPLLKKRPEIVDLCHRIKADLKRDMMAVYDDTAAIGKLYRRQDEIGTPWCVTVDVDSLEDGAVTVRERDTMSQERIPVEGVKRAILDKLDATRP